MTTDFNFINKNVIDNIKFTHIAESKIDGFGLFADKNLDSGTILCFLDALNLWSMWIEKTKQQ